MHGLIRLDFSNKIYMYQLIFRLQQTFFYDSTRQNSVSIWKENSARACTNNLHRSLVATPDVFKNPSPAAGFADIGWLLSRERILTFASLDKRSSSFFTPLLSKVSIDNETIKESAKMSLHKAHLLYLHRNTSWSIYHEIFCRGLGQLEMWKYFICNKIKYLLLLAAYQYHMLCSLCLYMLFQYIK